MAGFFDSFFDSISDAFSTFSLNEELENNIIENKFFNALRGKSTYDAKVLLISEKRPVNQNGRLGYLFTIKCRPVDLHNFIIPEPCSFNVPSMVHYVVSLHPTAYSDSVMFDTYPINVGDTVECFFDQQGPENEGKMRGIRFRPKRKSTSVGNFSQQCLNILEQASGQQSRTQTPQQSSQPLGGYVDGGKYALPRKIPKGNYDDKWFLVSKENSGKKRKIVYEDIRHKDCPCKPADPNSNDVRKYFTPQQYSAFMEAMNAFESGGNKKAFNFAGYVGAKQFGLSSLQGAGLITSTYRKAALKAGGLLNKKGTAYVQGGSKLPRDHKFRGKSVNSCGYGILNYLATKTWDGKVSRRLGVKNLDDYFNDKGNVQQYAMDDKTSGNIRSLKSLNAVDINNPCDMAGLLAVSHLVGICYGQALSVKNKCASPHNVPAETDKADGNGSFGTRYFIGVGNMVKFNGGCT
tara:strand:+ start:3826 stop:5214 length:1389 start_codon:yes stop_codon:yes gene_type:complete